MGFLFEEPLDLPGLCFSSTVAQRCPPPNIRTAREGMFLASVHHAHNASVFLLHTHNSNAPHPQISSTIACWGENPASHVLLPRDWTRSSKQALRKGENQGRLALLPEGRFLPEVVVDAACLSSRLSDPAPRQGARDRRKGRAEAANSFQQQAVPEENGAVGDSDCVCTR